MRPDRAVWLIITLLGLAVAVSRFLMLSATPFANGIDGYHYALQVESILSTGLPRIPDWSPVNYLLAALVPVAGSTIVAVKLGAALLAALPVWPGFLLGRALGGRAAWGLVLAGLLGASSALSYLSIEMLRNLGGLSALLFFLYSLTRVRAPERTWRTFAGTALAFLLAFLAHRTTAALGVVALVVFLWIDGGRRTRLALGSVILFAGGAVLARLGPHPADLGRFDGAFDLGPGLPVLSETFRTMLPAPLVIELTLAMMATWAIFVQRIVRRRRGASSTASASSTLPGAPAHDAAVSTTILAAALVAFLPIWDLSSLDFGFRLFVAGVPLAAAACVAWAAPRFSIPERLTRTRVVWLAGGCAITLAATLPTTAYDRAHDPPYARYAALVKRLELPADAVLICHRGLNLFAAHATGRTTISYVPVHPPAPDKLWRLACHVDWQVFERYAPEAIAAGEIRRLAAPYLLVREDAWQEFLDRLPRDLAEVFRDRWNPWERKPWYLREWQGE